MIKRANGIKPMLNFNWNKIEELIAESYITKNKHTKLDLYVLNYTPKTQFEGFWINETMCCRGLIVDKNNNIIARPFKKFFNLGEVKETQNLPNEMPKIYEKLDGSLGIQFYDNNKVCIATRGSFISEQAKFATNWIQNKGFRKSDFKDGFTYLYEIIYPENRIVIDYGKKSELILLAVKNIETGEEINYISESKRLGLSYAKQIKFYNMKQLFDYVSKMDATEEGFVLKYSNGLRVKIKGKTYLELHKILYGFSNISIWQCLKDGTNLNLILNNPNIPEDFIKSVKEIESNLKNQYNKIYNEAITVYNEIKKLSDRKSQALEIQKKYPKIQNFIFGLLNNWDISEMIWKKIKPKFQKILLEK